MALPGLGAVLAEGGVPAPGVALLGVVAAAAGSYAILALNDVLTRRSVLAPWAGGRRAARREHPWRPADDEYSRLATAAVVALAVLCAAISYALSPLCLLLVAVVAGLHVVRCLTRSAYVAVVAFGAACGLAGLAGWAAVAPLSPRALTVAAFLGLWGAGCRMADDLAHHDGLEATGTVAAAFGPVSVARADCVVGFAALAAVVTLPMAAMLNDVAMVLGVVVVAWPGARLWYRPSRAEAAAYHHSAMVYPTVVLLVALAPALVRAL